MNLRQLSVFVENKPGKLSNIINLLAEGGVDIRALSLADTADFGVLRMIAADTEKAIEVLKEAGTIVNATEVVAVKVPDKCGSLAKLLELLKEKEINIEYMYAFFSHDDKNAYMVFRVEDNGKMEKALELGGYERLTPETAGIK